MTEPISREKALALAKEAGFSILARTYDISILEHYAALIAAEVAGADRRDAERYRRVRTPTNKIRTLVWMNEPAMHVALSWDELDHYVDATIAAERTKT